MIRIAATAGLLLTSVACTGTADVDTGDPLDEAPDISGAYTVALSESSGCDDHPEALADWAQRLTVSGSPDALSFAFDHEGASFAGTVDASSFFEFGGAATVSGWALQVACDGVAGEDGDRWVLDGSLQIQAEGEAAATCSATAAFLASEEEG